MKCKQLLLLVILLMSGKLFAQSDSVKIYVNDSTAFWHKIIWTEKDTLNGKCIAVFEKNQKMVAVTRSYKDGLKDGAWKQYYPNGHLMEKISYRAGKRSGEYVLNDFLGETIIQGSYKNDLKHGNWQNKKLRINGRYVNGLKEGVWRWSEDGFNYYLYQFKHGELKGNYKIKPPDYPLRD